MDGRSTFLHRRGFELGSEKDSGVGQWLSHVRRGTAGPSRGLARGEAMRLCFPEKSMRINPHTKARERNLVKELGKIAP